MNLTELERVNEELHASQSANGANGEDKALLENRRSHLQTLQRQYAALEERYLETKMSG